LDAWRPHSLAGEEAECEQRQRRWRLGGVTLLVAAGTEPFLLWVMVHLEVDATIVALFEEELLFAGLVMAGKRFIAEALAPRLVDHVNHPARNFHRQGPNAPAHRRYRPELQRDVRSTHQQAGPVMHPPAEQVVGGSVEVAPDQECRTLHVVEACLGVLMPRATHRLVRKRCRTQSRCLLGTEATYRHGHIIKDRK